MKVTVVMVASHREGWQNHYVGQLDAKRVAHAEFFIPNFSWRKRLELMRDYASGLDRGHLLCFTDAWDVLFFGEEWEIVSSWKGAEGPILFGAERNCFPDPEKAGKYPWTISPWRFLNAGVMVAEAGFFADFLSGYNLEDVKDDQRFWTDVFLSDVGSLDTGCHLVHNCFMQEPGELRLLRGEPRVVNTITKSVPTFVHANGKSSFPPAVLMALLGEQKG